MLIIGKKMNEHATTWGWFCVWLQDRNLYTIKIFDGIEYAEIKRVKYDQKGDIIPGGGYLSGKEVLSALKEFFIQYCLWNSFYQEIKNIGEQNFMKMVEDWWNEINTVVTVEKDGIKIRKYEND